MASIQPELAGTAGPRDLAAAMVVPALSRLPIAIRVNMYALKELERTAAQTDERTLEPTSNKRPDGPQK
ncbi:MAG: hypothetical protein ABW167_16855 [Baekduia sp.]